MIHNRRHLGRKHFVFRPKIIFVKRSKTDESNNAEGLRILEDSLHRAVVMNYAIEGRYPQSLDHIVRNFGIHIDETRFIVHYTIFASNILPTITVIER